MIVKNEEQWVWYAIQSVLDHVDAMLIYDTGSKDTTQKIIRRIKSTKIKLSLFGEVSAERLVELRNQQLHETETAWFLLLDGDEVWTRSGIAEVRNAIDHADKAISAFISKTIVPVGDLFHYQEERAGKYLLKGRKGHMNLRVYRKDSEYKWKGVYPLEAYVDQKGVPIQNQEEKIEFLNNPYWHLTHLHRSDMDHGKKKLELGQTKDIRLPEVFYTTRPVEVPTPWIKFSTLEHLRATVLTPLLKLKRHMQ